MFLVVSQPRRFIAQNDKEIEGLGCLLGICPEFVCSEFARKTAQTSHALNSPPRSAVHFCFDIDPRHLWQSKCPLSQGVARLVRQCLFSGGDVVRRPHDISKIEEICCDTLQWNPRYGCRGTVTASFALIALVAWWHCFDSTLRKISVHPKYG